MGMTALEAIAATVWNLALEDAADALAGYEIGSPLLDSMASHSLQWIAKDQRSWARENAPDPRVRDWLDTHWALDGQAALPELAGYSDACWLVCVDGIAGIGIGDMAGVVDDPVMLTWDEVFTQEVQCCG